MADSDQAAGTQEPVDRKEIGNRAVQFSMSWGACGNHAVMMTAFAEAEIKRALATLPEGDAVSPVDVRWGVNVLLETIAKKFEENDTFDIWRSDAAALVRSFKHADPSQHPSTDRG